MRNLKLIKQENFNYQISEKFDWSFFVEKEGLYAIEISAKCRSAKQIGKGKDDEDLRIEINGAKFREIPSEKRPQYLDIPCAWNGAKLKNLKKTIFFLTWLEKKDKNSIISFIPDQGAYLEEIKVYQVENPEQEIEFTPEIQAEDGDRRPWIVFALIDLPLKKIQVKITCRKRKFDRDDVKIIIDNEIKRNKKANWFYRFWYWAGSFLQGKAQEESFENNLPQNLHYIEFWADRMPILHKVILELGKIEPSKLKAKVIWQEVNLRKESNSSSQILATLKRNEIVEILEKVVEGEAYLKEKGICANIWHKVLFNNREGYIFSKALEIEGEKEKTKKRIREIAEELDVDPDLMTRLAEEESGFFPYGVSEDEAKGIFQLMSITIDQIKKGEGIYGYPLENPFDIEQNIQGGIRYFKWLYEVYYKDEPQGLEKTLIGWNWRLKHTPKREKIDWSKIPESVQEFVKKILEKKQEGKSKIRLILGFAGILIALLISFILKEFFIKEQIIREEFRRENLEQTEIELFSDLDSDGKIEKLFFEEIQPEKEILILRKVNAYLQERNKNELLLENLDGQLSEVRIIDLNQDNQKEIIISLTPSNRAITQIYTFENSQLKLIPIIPQNPDQGFFNRHGIKIIDLEGDGVKEIFVPQEWFYTKECQGKGEIYKYYDGQFVKFLEAKESLNWCENFKG